MEKIKLEKSAYLDKKFEVAKSILSSVMTIDELERGESKFRESLIFNTVRMAESLMDEFYETDTVNDLGEREIDL